MAGASTSLPADPASVPAARRFVETVLAEWGHSDLVEPVRLCVSELVTNVIIHAQSPVRLSLHDNGDRLRVDVDDESQNLPAAKHHALDAATGRGLHLVEFLAGSWGAEPTPEGKRVWFEFDLDGSEGEAPGPEAETTGSEATWGAGVEASAPSGGHSMPEYAGELAEVRLVGLPVELYHESNAHHDELRREFTLIAHSVSSRSLPARLRRIADELSTRFGGFAAPATQNLIDARTAGVQTMDLVYRVPIEVADAAQYLRALFDEADEYCRREELITLATPDDLLAFRRWFLSEFTSQLNGALPLPWPGAPSELMHGECSADQWAFLIETQEAAAVVTDEQGYVVRWNRGATEVFGYRPSEVRGRHLFSLLAPAPAVGAMQGVLGEIMQWHVNMQRQPLWNKHCESMDMVGYAMRVLERGEPVVAMVGIPAGAAGGPVGQPSRATWARLRTHTRELVAALAADESDEILRTMHDIASALADSTSLDAVRDVVTACARSVSGAVSATLITDDSEGIDDLEDPFPAEPADWLQLPLRLESKTVAVLQLEFDAPRLFPETDRRILATLADVGGHAVARVRALDAARHTAATLGTLLESAPVGVAFFDRDLRVIRMNPQLAAMNAIDVDDVAGRHVDDVLPRGGAEIARVLESALASGQATLGVEWRGPTTAHPDRARTYVMDIYPVREPQSPALGVGLLIRDVTEERAVTTRLASLQQLTAQLAQTTTVEDVARAAIEQGVHDLGARTGSLSVLHDDTGELEVIASLGYDERVLSAWSRFQLDADLPASEVTRTGTPLFFATPDDRDARYPILATAPVVDNAASAIVPLAAEGRGPRGVLVIGFEAPHQFDESDRSFLTAVATQCAVALERVELAARVQRALTAAQRGRALLASLLERAPVGLAFFDTRGRCVQVNETVADAITGEPLDAHGGRALSNIPALAASDEHLRRVVASGEPVLDIEFTSSGDGAGRRHWLASWYPVHDDAGVAFAVGVVFLEITKRKEAEQELARLLDTERAARAAAEATTRWVDRLITAETAVAPGGGLDELLADLLASLRELFGADSAALLIANDEGTELAVRGAVGLAAEIDVVHIPAGTGFAGRVFASRRPLIVDDLSRFQIASPMLRNSGLQSLVGVPLISEENAVGVMHVGSRARARFRDQDAERLGLIADRIAGALERSRLLSRERAARAEAELAQNRLAFISEASRLVGSTLDRHAILEEVVALAVPRIADFAAAFEREGDDIVYRAVRAAQPIPAELEPLLATQTGAAVGQRTAVSRVWRSGEAMLIPDARAEAHATLPPDVAATLDHLGIRSAMVVPVGSRGRTEVVLSFGATDARPHYTADDLALARELAGRVGSGLANAALYEREHSVAEALTRAVLPDTLPNLAGLELSAKYRPAGPNVEVGGDWYDAFRIPDGRIALVIGDVAGHGLHAAAVMVQLRNAVRALAFDGRSPSSVLERAAALLESGENDDAAGDWFATVLFAIFDPATGELRWASAGHPPPLYTRRGHAGFLGTVPGPVLGAGVTLAYPEHGAELEPGSGVVLYTDGLVERRDEAFDDGLDRLAGVARTLESLEPGRVCTDLLDVMMAGVDLYDDCCILCIHRPA